MTRIASGPSPASASLVDLTVNGQTIQGVQGQTVLEAATAAGIYIPTLCYHPAISAHGGCRMCVVEIQKQRGLQPACTFPISGGLVIDTEAPRVVEARKFVLEMLFSERSHYCMFCPASGGEHTSECELQRLAYRYGLTHWEYPPDTHRNWPLDATRRHFVMDHSRCILCRRCVRACGELAGSYTLGLEHRGARAMICADDGVPLGESTCVNCGTCLQICPTGALMDRRSAFCGHEPDLQRTRTTCLACGAGCPIETVVRHNRVLRIEGVWDAQNKGVLCEDGRFNALLNGAPRVDSPLIRRNGEVEKCSFDEALSFAADKLACAKRVGGLITARSTNEALLAFAWLFSDLFRSDELSLMSASVPPLDIGTPAGVADLTEADVILVIGSDPWRQQKALAYLARRAMYNGAQLIVASAEPTELDNFADLVVRLSSELPSYACDPHRALGQIYHIRSDQLTEVKQAIDQAKRPVVLYGAGLDDAIVRTLHMLPSRTRFLPLFNPANAVGATELGLTVRALSTDLEVLYILAGEEDPGEMPLPPAAFTIIQSVYHNPWTQQADVVLPARRWDEKQGHIARFDGERLPLNPSVEAPAGILPDWATLFMLSLKLGRPLTCITVAQNARRSHG